MKILFDVESNGLDDATKVHCAASADVSFAHPLLVRYEPHQIGNLLTLLSQAKEVIGHNILCYDLPLLFRLYPDFKLKEGCVITDTLVMARYIYSDIKGADFDRFNSGTLPGRLIGRHSLEAWGYRIGVLKGDYGETTDWQEYTPEMLDYCERDVEVNFHVYNYLCQSWNGIPEIAQELEHQVAAIINQQKINGFLFDINKAEKLELELVARRSDILDELTRAGFKGFYKPMGEFTPKSDNKRYGYTAGSKVTRIKYIDFNADSRDHVAYWFKKKYNWKPTLFTKAKNPQAILNEEVLEKLPYPEAKILAENFKISKVLGMLSYGKNAWLKLVQADGRIHGRVNTNGAVTGRMTHSDPNMAQIPSARSELGKKCRELFIVPTGRKLVGVDASGLELRMLAHYLIALNKGGAEIEYVNQIMSGDIHQYNADILGIDRNTAKTFIYSYLYGASPKKLSKVIGCNIKEGKKRQDQFSEKIPELTHLVNQVQAAANKRGFLVGLDGRIVPVRSQHLALNTLLQSAGAVVMKKALVIMAEKVKGMDALFVANVHDEIQTECEESIADKVLEYGTQSIVEAGIALNINVALEGSGSIGNNWRETH